MENPVNISVTLSILISLKCKEQTVYYIEDILNKLISV